MCTSAAGDFARLAAHERGSRGAAKIVRQLRAATAKAQLASARDRASKKRATSAARATYVPCWRWSLRTSKRTTRR